MTEALAAIDDAGGFKGAEVSPVGLTFDPDLPYERWAEIGALIGNVRDSSAWWIGAWVNFGEAAYGEKYAQAIDATGLDYGRLRNIASVEARVELSRRRYNLSFYHHEQVAALKPGEQTKWLDRAEKKGWSGRELRDALREAGLVGAPAAQPAWSGTPEEQLREAREEVEALRKDAERAGILGALEDDLVRTGTLVRCPECGQTTLREAATVIES